MTPAAPSTPVAAPDDPVRAVLADGRVRADLLVHARAVVNRRLRDRPALERVEAAEIAVQETACRALDKKAAYNAADGAVTAWLHGILTRVLFDTTREIRRRPTQPPDDPAAWDRLATALAPSAGDSAGDRLDAAGILSHLAAD